MPEQPPQWSERTLDMPPQDPWAEPPTAPVPGRPGEPAAPPPPSPFSRGRAQVNPHPRTQQYAAEHEPTGTGWPGSGAPRQNRSGSWHLNELRRGGEWTSAALLFAFVCWGIWAISTDGDLTTPIVVFVCSLFVALGLFVLARVLGGAILEKQLGRVRRSARGAHLVAAVFLVGVGLAHLQQTEWVMDAYHWVVGLF
ncbi:DNA-directed RNA polymerase II [Jidongwangia harbinensis]|uniref:DNA-directed RNA polymerase II n=1 Tax=Jidongwangia harbinensis TaxID=2878561 RepID=UPI001CD91C9B|nr:DNA-directed RNA polymerase II [Jidongwangia harbinensis]MCA2216735.1 DNA-directed RNA polymerase II [Jidongwangia harbinensis]